MTPFKQNKIKQCLVIASGCFASLGVAQESDGLNQPDKGAETTLEVIEVTSQKRTQTLQEVPASR